MGAAATPIAGRLGDRGHARITLCVSHIVIIISAVLSAWADSAGSQLWAFGALGLGGILLDLGVTGDQTLGRRAVNLLQPEDPAAFRRRMREYCRDKLAKFKVPAKIEIVANEQYNSRYKKMRRVEAPSVGL